MSETWELRLGALVVYVGATLLVAHDLGLALVVGGAGYLTLVLLEFSRQRKKEAK